MMHCRYLAIRTSLVLKNCLFFVDEFSQLIIIIISYVPFLLFFCNCGYVVMLLEASN